MEVIKEYSKKYFLPPGDCNPQQQLPMSGLVAGLIDVATLHANEIGVGYASLIDEDEAWVLTRVTVEMKRYPNVGEYYTITTWVESYNRKFSERDYAIIDEEGNEIGYARSIWVAINSKTRESADISRLSYITADISDRPCPIAKQSRMLPFTPTRSSKYRFRYSDTDYNRHVNTCRYIELLLDQWTLDFWDLHRLQRFEIAFLKETLFGMEVDVLLNEENDDCRIDLVYEGDTHCKARLVFVEEAELL